MSKLSFDYSKWDRIDDSEDEETFYDGFDKALNMRVNRMDRDRKDEAIDMQLKELKEAGNLKKAESLENKRPIHVGNACHVKEEKTIINSSSSTSGYCSDPKAFSTESYLKFKVEHAQVLADYANADWEQSHRMLILHGDILFTELARSHFNLSALDEAMNGNTASMKRLCHQGEIITKIFAIAEPVHRHPRDMVDDFFTRFAVESVDPVRVCFQADIDQFAVNIQKRADEKKREQEEQRRRSEAAVENTDLRKEPLVKAMYSMSKDERVGPGGLDPIEVLESLPSDLQEAFRQGDIEMLTRVAEEMPEEEFNEHLQRCIDSGLWKE